MSSKKRLQTVRNSINEIDEQIIELMAKRTQLAPEIAKLKFSLDMDILDSSREKDVYAKTREISKKYDFDSEIAIEVMKILIEQNKKLQLKQLEKLKLESKPISKSNLKSE
jgi:chorismate mutase